MNDELTKRIKRYLKECLSQKRYTHSMNVADSAKDLAELYGEDTSRAYFAGMVHDIAKELEKNEQKKLAEKIIDICKIELETSALLHAPAGAQLLREKFGIEDEEILLAVRQHTIAAGNMSRLSQIVYLADLICVDRDYKDVKKMRKYANTSLEKGMYEALKFSISDQVDKGGFIPNATVDAYNEFVEKK